MAHHLLLVDDDRSLIDVLGMAFEDAGFSVETAHDGLAGWEAFSRRTPDVAVLDLLMPEIDGLELCRRIRAEHTTPIVLLTSRDAEMDRVLGLELGADDYVTKPFSTRVLIARVRAILRRVQLDRPPEDARTVGGLRMDRTAREAVMAGSLITLTATEFDLLWTLIGTPGRVFSRDNLIDEVYGHDIVVSDRTIDTFVKRLRKKLQTADPSFAGIETIRSVGYRYCP